ncbi:MAG: class I SAM-dependent methyltransferase [Clostridia bacterium]|nr:class I SAM-dependent methyltransferase [Clostridia bacterium]
MQYQDVNAETVDRWVREGWEWGRPIDRETFQNAKNGTWDVLLTPTVPVPHAWIGDLRGKTVLGLASGGGQQMPVFAACGAVCTVLDYSEEQLKAERLVAAREGYAITVVRADMTKPLPFPDGSFDLVFHPVSNCYVRDVRPIFKECFRVLKPGGVLLAGLDNGINYLFDGADETRVVNSLPFDPLANPAQMEQLARSDGGVQFSHTAEEQIGGQLEAGFRLTHLYEDTNGEGRLHELHIPTFYATRAIRPGKEDRP